MKKINILVIGFSLAASTVVLALTSNLISQQPSPIVKISNKRYSLPINAKRSVYKTEAECKNAVPADFWPECEAANSYYSATSELGDKWLGPVYSGSQDPNLSQTAQNLPVSTLVANNRNVGKGPLGKLINETRSPSSTYKPTASLSTSNLSSKSDKLPRLKPQTKIQPIR
jgi:hypothetical protein